MAGTQRQAGQAIAETTSAFGQSLFASTQAGTLWTDWQQYLHDASQRFLGMRSDMVAYFLDLVARFEQLLGVPFDAAKNEKTGAGKLRRSGMGVGAGTPAGTVRSRAGKAAAA